MGGCCSKALAKHGGEKESTAQWGTATGGEAGECWRLELGAMRQRAKCLTSISDALAVISTNRKCITLKKPAFRGRK